MDAAGGSGVCIKEEPVDRGYEAAEKGMTATSSPTSSTKAASVPTPVTIALSLLSNPTAASSKTITSSLPAGVVLSPSVKKSPGFTLGKPGMSLLSSGNSKVGYTVHESGKQQKTVFVLHKQVGSARPASSVNWTRLPMSRVNSSGLPSKVMYPPSSQQKTVFVAGKPNVPIQIRPVPKPLVIEPRNDDGLPCSSLVNVVDGSTVVPQLYKTSGGISSLVMTNDIKDLPTSDATDGDGSQNRAVCGLVFNNSKSAKAAKQYLCNFCKFSVTTYSRFNAHLAEHVFSCNHCSFKAFTRFHVLKHRQEHHPEFSHELIGYEGLDKLVPSKTSPGMASSQLQSKTGAISLNQNTASSSSLPFSTLLNPAQQSRRGSAPIVNITPANAKLLSPGSVTSPVILSVSGADGKTVGSVADSRVEMPSSPSSQPTSTVKLWKCYYCDKKSDVQSELVTHIKAQHPGKTYKLQSISRISKGHRTAGRDSTDNEETQDSSKQFIWVCYYCDATDPDRSSIIAHVKEKHKNSKIVIRRKKLGKEPEEGTSEDGPPVLTRFDSEQGTDAAKQDGISQPKPGSPRVPTLEREDSCTGTGQEVGSQEPLASQQQLPVEAHQLPSENKEKNSDDDGAHSKNDTAIKVIYTAHTSPDDLMIVDQSKSKAQCAKCGKVLYGKRCVPHMREHTVTHTQAFTWQCGLCMRKFRRRNLCVQHFQSEHLNELPTMIRFTIDNRLFGKTFLESMDAEKKKVPWTPKLDSLFSKVIGRKDFQSLAGGAEPEASSQADPGTDPLKTDVPETAQLTSRPQHRLTFTLLGPRSARERCIRKHATYMWKCPYCARHSIYKGLIMVHIKFVHPAKRVVDPWRIKRPDADITRAATVQNKQKAAVHLVRLEDMAHYEHLRSVLESGGSCLIHDKDQDDREVLTKPDVLVSRVKPKVPVKKRRSPEYTCILCSRLGAHREFRSPIAIKRHLATFHNDKEFAVYVSSPKGNQSILFLCPDQLCRFSCPVKAAMTIHHVRNPSHVKHKDVPANGTPKSGIDEASSCAKDHGDEDDIPLAKLPKDSVVSLAKGKTADKCNTGEVPSPPDRSPLKLTLMIPKTAPGKLPDSTEPIFVVKSREDNLKGSSLLTKKGSNREVAHGPDSAASSVLKSYLTGPKLGKLKCLYCGYPATFDRDDLKNHLLMEHPRENPIVANATTTVEGRQGSKTYYICPVLFCPAVMSNRAEFIRHISGAHQDRDFSIPMLNPQMVCSEVTDGDEDADVDLEVPVLENPKPPSRQRKRKFDDSDDERDADFDPKRPNFHPDYPSSGGKKSKSRRKPRNRKPSQQQVAGVAELTATSVPETANCSDELPSSSANQPAPSFSASAGSNARIISTGALQGNVAPKGLDPRGASSITTAPDSRFRCHLCSEVVVHQTEMKAHIHASHANHNGPYTCTDLVAKKKRKRSIRRFCPREHCDFMTDGDYDCVLKHLTVIHDECVSEEARDFSDHEAPKRRTRTAAARRSLRGMPLALRDGSEQTETSGKSEHTDIQEETSDIPEKAQQHDGGNIECERTSVEHDTREHSQLKEKAAQAECQTSGRVGNSVFCSAAQQLSHAADDAGEMEDNSGDTNKNLREIGEENRLNKDFKKWLGSSKSCVPPKSHHLGNSRLLAEVTEPVSREASQASFQGSDSKAVENSQPGSPAVRTSLPPQDEQNLDFSQEGMAKHQSDSASSTAEEVEESESDACEMPDISDSRFSPRRAVSDVEMEVEEEEKDNLQTAGLPGMPRRKSSPCSEIQNNDELKSTSEEGMDTVFSSTAAAREDCTSDQISRSQNSDYRKSMEKVPLHSSESHLDSSDSLAFSQAEANRGVSADTSSRSDSWRSDGLNSTSEGNISKEEKEEDECHTDNRSSKTTRQSHSTKEKSREFRDFSSDSEHHRQRYSDAEFHETSSEGEQLRSELEMDSRRHQVGGAKMYQCHECSFMTTSHVNIEQHMVEEHESSRAGFMEIDTGFDHDGNIITNVNG